MKEFFAPSTYWASNPHDPFKYFSLGHISVIVLTFITLVLLIIFKDKFSHKFIKRYLCVSSIVWLGLEIFKITLYLLTSGNTRQALQEVLPLYMCSLFVYMLPLVAFGRGIIKQIGEYTLVTLSMLAGILTVIVCPALLNYPVWSFFSLHSLLYHAFMTLTGVLLVISGYVKMPWKKFFYPMITILILAVPAIIMNNVVDTDYMLMHYAWGVPLTQNIAAKLGQVPLIIVMILVYTALTVLMTALNIGIAKVLKKKTPPAN